MNQNNPADKPQNLEIQLGQKTISYTRFGKDRPVVLFLHGLGARKEAWRPQQALISKYAHCLAMDLPGHGMSSIKVERGDLDEFTGLIEGFLDALNIEQVHIVAHSLGTEISVPFAISHPERVLSMTLLGGTGPGTHVNERFFKGYINSDDPEEMASLLALLFNEQSIVNERMVETSIKAMQREGMRETLNKITGQITNQAPEPAYHYLSRVSCPVTLIWGQDDQITTPIDPSSLPENVRLILIEGVGHMVQVEALDRVNSLILEALAS